MQFLVIASFKASAVLNLVVLVSLSPYSKSGSRRMLVTSPPGGDSPGPLIVAKSGGLHGAVLCRFICRASPALSFPIFLFGVPR
jgi:hypothetical protein